MVVTPAECAQVGVIFFPYSFVETTPSPIIEILPEIPTLDLVDQNVDCEPELETGSIPS